MRSSGAPPTELFAPVVPVLFNVSGTQQAPVRAPPTNTDCPPKTRPQSPRITVQYAPCASNGPIRLGFCAPSGRERAHLEPDPPARRADLHEQLLGAGAPTNMDYPPPRWPGSPRIVMRCAPRASNGPDHLGLRAPSRSGPAGITRSTAAAPSRSSGQRTRRWTTISLTVGRRLYPCVSTSL